MGREHNHRAKIKSWVAAGSVPGGDLFFFFSSQKQMLAFHERTQCVHGCPTDSESPEPLPEGPGVRRPGLGTFHPQEAIGTQKSKYLKTLGHSGS